MEFLYEIGVFLTEAIILVLAIVLAVAGIVAVTSKRGGDDSGYIEVRLLNDRYEGFNDALRVVTESEDEAKQRKKAEKKAKKAEEKAAKKKGEDLDGVKPRVFVLEFDGDMRASQTEDLREEITAVLTEAKEGDEVLVKLESPGGVVHGYGLAASQLQRIKNAQIPLTVAVDKVAASGGYMMACVADTILAAPFAILGSIGVLAQVPNVHRLLKKHDVDFEVLTAGEYKRTLTVFGENTEKGRQKFIEDLEDTHHLFKQWVSENRPAVDIDKVATGEVWYGQQAMNVALIDAIQTSDDFIQAKIKEADVLEISYQHKKTWQEKLGLTAESAVERGLLKIWQSARQPRTWM